MKCHRTYVPYIGALVCAEWAGPAGAGAHWRSAAAAAAGRGRNHSGFVLFVNDLLVIVVLSLDNYANYYTLIRARLHTHSLLLLFYNNTNM